MLKIYQYFLIGIFRLFVLSIFFTGCVTNIPQDSFHNKNKAIVTNRISTPSISNKQQTAKIDNGVISLEKNRKIFKNRVRVLVIATPKDAKIRIMNIKPKYRDNILLKKGKYLIEVSKDGYETYKKWINLQKYKILHVNLKKRKISALSFDKDFIWREHKIEDRFRKYSLYTLMDNLKISMGKKRIWLDNKVSKAHNVKWNLANRYCNSLHLYNLKWRLPNCKDANYYYNEVRNFLINSTYKAPWTNRKNIKAMGYKNGCEYYTGDSYYMQFECVASKPRINNKSVLSIASTIVKENKNISKQKALQEALNLKFGNPKIRDIGYNLKDKILYFTLTSSRIKDIVPSKPKPKLRNALTSKNSQRVKEYIKVYNFKDESVIVFNPLIYYMSKYKAFEFDKIKNFRNLVFGDYIFDDSLKYASTIINARKKRIYIFVDKIESNRYELSNFLVLPKMRSITLRGEETLFVDPKIISNVKNIREYFFKKRINLKISPKYAKEMITLISSPNFKPTVVFGIKDGKLVYRGIKELTNKNDFVEKEEFKRLYYDVRGLRKFIKKYPNSLYVKKAKERIREIKKLYKGYEPFGIFKVDGCVGYFPYNLITKNISKLKINPATIQPYMFKKITWYSLCRRGLLSGRGVMNMVFKDGNFMVKIEGKMRDGFFIGDVKRVNKRVTKRISKTTYYFKNDVLHENIELKNYKDYEKYQKESR